MRSPADRADSLFNTFSVGSTNHTAPFSVSGFSSRGPSGCGGAYAMKPEIMAPGADIYSAQPGGGYQYLDGTSMAGPHIAGVVALMRSANPGLDVETIKQILMDTAIDMGVTGEDNDTGHGFVDAYAAVLQVMSGYGTLEGTVTDVSTSLPIAGASVVFTAAGELNRTRTTNASGFYNIMLPQGDWDLDFSAFGYLGDTVTGVTVVEDMTTTQDVQLAQAPSALLSGHVYDDESAPVDGATITVLGTPLAPATSGLDGYYEITMPTGAVYEVLASAYGMGSQQVTLDFQGAATQDFFLPQLIFDNFESGTLVVFPWATSGDADWFVTTDQVYEGAYSVKSGDITHSQSSVLSITLDVLAAGNLEFYYKVSSESGYDYLSFSIDGGQQNAWAGEIDWTLASYPVDAGPHTFSWSYDKDGSVDTGGDCAWLDYVVFPTIAPPTYPELAVSPPDLTETLQPGATSVQYITLDNNGEGELIFTASVTMDLPPAAASREAIEPGKGDPDPRVGQSPLLGSGGPDAYGYNWIDSDEFGGPSYDWAEINAVGTALALTDDSVSGDLPLGFTFKFYGADFTTVRVCSNGFLSFTSSDNSYTNDPIPDAQEPNNLIAAYWDDLNPASAGTVYYYADAANNRFIVEWDAVVHYGTSDPQTFQVILNGDQTIVFQYATTNGQSESTVGIEDGSGAVGLQVVFNAPYIHDGLATLFSFVPPPDPWLTVTPTSGTVPGLTTGTQLEVGFNATDLTEGTYTGHVTIGSNDPDNPQVFVPVTLVVSTSTAVGDDTLPRSFALGAAYPNPFN
ncbi:S8 family serine peptidase, partial [bacterium]|nr:S8 family serine peptidase [bacterium]